MDLRSIDIQKTYPEITFLQILGRLIQEEDAIGFSEPNSSGFSASIFFSFLKQYFLLTSFENVFFAYAAQLRERDYASHQATDAVEKVSVSTKGLARHSSRP